MTLPTSILTQLQNYLFDINYVVSKFTSFIFPCWKKNAPCFNHETKQNVKAVYKLF